MKGKLEGASEQGGPEEPPWGESAGYTSEGRAPFTGRRLSAAGITGRLPPAQGHRQGPLSHGHLVPGTSLTLKMLSLASPKAPSLTSPAGPEISTSADLGLKTAAPGSSSLLTITLILNWITVLGVDLLLNLRKQTK